MSQLNFGSKICKYREDILRDLATLVAIPSVRGEAEKGAPFGKHSAEALECILRMAEGMGLDAKNIDGYAGHAEYGSGEEIAAVLAHVDVVPAGNGWDTDPFRLTLKDGLVYGRGTADDKGPAIAALYCLKVLKEEQVMGNRRLRVIFGASEETGMEDMAYYFAKEPLPSMAFTPDSDYGICNREKGILRFDLCKNGNDSAVVKEFHGGLAVNSVPDRACAKIVCTQSQLEALAAAASGGGFSLERTENGACIVSFGKAAHAMQPHVGKNAAAHLIRLLFSVFERDAVGAFLSAIDEKIGLETDGSSFGVKTADEPSGSLTLNLGLLNMTAEKSCAGIDIRYPVTADGGRILETVTSAAHTAGLRVESAVNTPPLYLPEDSPLISLLKDAYRAATGQEAALYATGGGTYARSLLGRGVAFGPFFPDEPDRKLHDANENIDMDRFMIHAQICLEAMYRLLTF